jgi:integrase
MGQTKRARGSIYKQPGCSTWTIQYFQSGRRVREASGLEDFRAAQQLLTKRLAAVDAGEVIELSRRRMLVEELWRGLEMHYTRQRRKSAESLKYRWLYLGPFFGEMPAVNVFADTVDAYIDQRLLAGAAHATVNREISALKTAFRIGCRDRKLRQMPAFPEKLEERNVREGFVENVGFEKLVANCSEPWLQLFLEIAYGLGWRKSEILGLRCKQVSLEANSLRLNVGETKSGEGREVTMTLRICALARRAMVGKLPDDFLLTRANGKAVRNFREAWTKLTKAAGLEGTLVHDLRRSAARQLRRAGVTENVVMEIGGWKTAAVFKRYDIVNNADTQRAIVQLEQSRAADLLARQNSHDFSHDSMEGSVAGAGVDRGRVN